MSIGIATSSDRATGLWMRRAFGVVFGLEGLVAVVSMVLSIAGRDDFIPPAVALVVAVHLYPFALIFERRIDYCFATALAVASLLGLVVMAAVSGSALTVIALVALAAALTTASYGFYFVRQQRLRQRRSDS